MKYEGSQAASFELESREDHRAIISRVSVRYERAVGQFVVGDARDLSAGGIFVKASKPLPSGAVAELEIRIAGEARPLYAVARVVWSRAVHAGEDRPTGMGMKFLDLDGRAEGVIRCLVTGRDPTLPGIGSARPPALFVPRIVGGTRASEASAPLLLVRRKQRLSEDELEAWPLALVQRKAAMRTLDSGIVRKAELEIARQSGAAPRLVLGMMVLAAMTALVGGGSRLAVGEVPTLLVAPTGGSLPEPRALVVASSAWAVPEAQRDKTRPAR
jgi:uncharacterized protein (TIGR02266 family)